MNAEILAIGDEITSGQTLDTNSQWISQQLEDDGIRVLYHSTVGDELEPCTEIFRQAIDRADLIIATGGLGPTADDLTREALAKATQRELVLFPEALDHLRAFFAKRGRPMPERNERQAWFPAESQMIFNPHGTAPGIHLEIPRPGRLPCHFIALPGVPAELKEMWVQSVAADIQKIAGRRKVILRHKINCFGAGESQIESMLPDLIRRGRQPTVGITASKTTISLRITAEADSESDCTAQITSTVTTIEQSLGSLIFGLGDEALQHAVLKLLENRKQTLSTVECGTGGLIADWLHEVEIHETPYRGGITLPAIAKLPALFGDDIVDANTPLDEETLLAHIAKEARQRFHSDWTLTVGSFPHQDSTTPHQVHFALASPTKIYAHSVPYVGHPATRKIYMAKWALNFLRLTLSDPST